MREIKFRAWDKENENMLHADMIDLCRPKANDFRIFVDDNFCDISLMQYTGLKDKNGKEIYEGDIIKSDGSYPLEVYWMGLAWGTRWNDNGNIEEEIICDDAGDMTIGKGDVLIYMQVIGNKWETK